MKSIYLIGSLRNPEISKLAERLRKHGFEVFDQWLSAGPEADDFFQKYCNERGFTYKQALQTHAAKNTFNFDKKHLDACDVAIMVMPAGKSAHIELGYVRGCGKPGYILMDKEPERYDIMYQFATDIFTDEQTLVEELTGERKCTDHRWTEWMYSNSGLHSGYFRICNMCMLREPVNKA